MDCVDTLSLKHYIVLVYLQHYSFKTTDHISPVAAHRLFYLFIVSGNHVFNCY